MILPPQCIRRPLGNNSRLRTLPGHVPKDARTRKLAPGRRLDCSGTVALQSALPASNDPHLTTVVCAGQPQESHDWARHTHSCMRSCPTLVRLTLLHGAGGADGVLSIAREVRYKVRLLVAR